MKWRNKNQMLWGFLLLSIMSLFLQWLVFGFILPTKLIVPWLLYGSLLLMLRPYYASFTVFLLESLLLRIHLMKMAHTNTAFEASDIFAWRQALFLKSYTDFVVPSLAILILFCLYKGFVLRKRQLAFLPVVLLVTTSCVQERNPTQKKTNPVSLLFSLAKVNYVDWNFATNVKENGILNHLFLTLPMGQIPAKGKVSLGERNVAASGGSQEAPDVFLILCESCYTSSSTKFVTPMADLVNEGFHSTTMISPVYGGMTAEAEFEVLTGLPSQRYKGIDFQYFADSYSSHAIAIPRVLANVGYATFSSHNNQGFYWRRDVVHPKFGFQKSVFLENMGWQDMAAVPADDILFEKALKQYQENLNYSKKTFSFLITIHTHGPYKETNNDGGEADYKAKLKTSMDEFIKFQKEVYRLSQAKQRPVLFVIFGDHKPAMTVSFYRKHVFTDDFFESTDTQGEGLRFSSLSGSQRLVYGRVPVFIKAWNMKNPSAIDQVAHNALDKPLYCLPGVLSDLLPFHHEFYGYLKKICQRPSEQLVDKSVIDSVFPEQIYGNLLFE